MRNADTASGPGDDTPSKQASSSVHQPQTVTSLRFGKDCRLLRASDYRPVFDKARFKVSTPEILLLAIPNTLGHARMGLVIGRKHAKRAVTRNCIKRVSRETFRHQLATLPALDIIVLGRKGIGQLEKSALHSQLQQLLHQLTTKAARHSNR